MKSLKDILKELSPTDRAAVELRAHEIIGEEVALQNLRKALAEHSAVVLALIDDLIERGKGATDVAAK